MRRERGVGSLRGVRVCMLTSTHAPDDDRIYFKEARSLGRAGARITIVCPEGKTGISPPEGITFRQFPRFPSPLRRLGGSGGLARLAKEARPDILHCHEPDALLAAVRAADGRIPVIYDSHEMWGAVAAGRFPPGTWSIAEESFKVLERRLVARSAGGIGASWAISGYLAETLGEENVETILNVPAADVFGLPPERTWGAVTYLCHDGHLSDDRGLRIMVEAVRTVSRRHRVVLKIVGDVYGAEREWLDGYLKANRCEGLVERTGWLPYRDVGSALGTCHIGLVALQRNPNNVVTSSNKVFNYMLYGIPFIGPDFRLSKQRLVREEGCGVLADSSSADSYARAISRLIEDRTGTEEMSRRAREASRLRYRWEHMEKRLVGLYEKVLG